MACAHRRADRGSIVDKTMSAPAGSTGPPPEPGRESAVLGTHLRQRIVLIVAFEYLVDWHTA